MTDPFFNLGLVTAKTTLSLHWRSEESRVKIRIQRKPPDVAVYTNIGISSTLTRHKFPSADHSPTFPQGWWGGQDPTECQRHWGEACPREGGRVGHRWLGENLQHLSELEVNSSTQNCQEDTVAEMYGTWHSSFPAPPYRQLWIWWDTWRSHGSGDPWESLLRLRRGQQLVHRQLRIWWYAGRSQRSGLKLPRSPRTSAATLLGPSVMTRSSIRPEPDAAWLNLCDTLLFMSVKSELEVSALWVLTASGDWATSKI